MNRLRRHRCHGLPHQQESDWQAVEEGVDQRYDRWTLPDEVALDFGQQQPSIVEHRQQGVDRLGAGTSAGTASALAVRLGALSGFAVEDVRPVVRSYTEASGEPPDPDPGLIGVAVT